MNNIDDLVPWIIVSPWILMTIIFVGSGILKIWALVHAIKKHKDDVEKIIWIFIILLVPCGALVYFIFGKPKKKTKNSDTQKNKYSSLYETDEELNSNEKKESDSSSRTYKNAY